MVAGPVVVIAALVLTDGTYRFGIITSMIMAIVSLSLVLLTGFAGQVSLAQAAFAGTGGFVMSRLATAADIPFPFSLVLGALARERRRTSAIAVPALRVRGSQLAVVDARRGGRGRAVHLRQSGDHAALGNQVPDAEPVRASTSRCGGATTSCEWPSACSSWSSCSWWSWWS